MGGRRPAGAERAEVPESNTHLPVPTSTLMAAVRDRVRRANNPITLRGLQLGRQPETAKEFAFLLTCRGIDENKCIQLLRNRQTPSRRSARIPFGMPLPKARSELDATYAFGHAYNHFHRCLFLLRSTLTRSRYRRIPRSLDPVELTICERHSGAQLAQSGRRSPSHPQRVRRINFCWAP